jgi:hypothetical protein
VTFVLGCPFRFDFGRLRCEWPVQVCREQEQQRQHQHQRQFQ